MKKGIFRRSLSSREIIFGLLLIPVHAYVVPSIVLYIISLFNITGLSDAKLNLICYLFSFVLVLIFLGRYLKAMFSVMLDSPFRLLFVTVIGFVIYLILSLVVSAIFKKFAPAGLLNPNNEAITGALRGSGAVALMLSLVIAPVTEETLFRGVVFGSLRPYSRVLAYAVSFALFALYHLWRSLLHGFDTSLLWCALQYLPGSLALAFCYEQSGCIYSSVLLHAMINAMSVLSIAF